MGWDQDPDVTRTAGSAAAMRASGGTLSVRTVRHGRADTTAGPVRFRAASGDQPMPFPLAALMRLPTSRRPQPAWSHPLSPPLGGVMRLQL